MYLVGPVETVDNPPSEFTTAVDNSSKSGGYPVNKIDRAYPRAPQHPLKLWRPPGGALDPLPIRR